MPVLGRVPANCIRTRPPVRLGVRQAPPAFVRFPARVCRAPARNHSRDKLRSLASGGQPPEVLRARPLQDLLSSCGSASYSTRNHRGLSLSRHRARAARLQADRRQMPMRLRLGAFSRYRPRALTLVLFAAIVAAIWLANLIGDYRLRRYQSTAYPHPQSELQFNVAEASPDNSGRFDQNL